MSGTQKNKYMGKPFIKKIYETHRKWLGGDSKRQEKAETLKKPDEEKKVPEYENVEFKSVDTTDSFCTEKLRIVINSFDKILDEYSTLAPEVNNLPVTIEVLPKKPNFAPEPSETPIKVVPPPRKHPSRVRQRQEALVKPKPPEPTISKTKIPKLVKAKTCSIIESKCILKKANSENPPPSLPNVPVKTKSMTNLDVNSSPVKIVPICMEPPEIKKKITPLKPVPPGKVKELVKRLNSLTEISNPEVAPVLSKAVSTTNLSLSKKHGSASKIPVNSNLRKSFPSTPCHLDQLDNNGSAELSKTKSVQNLTKPKLSLPAAAAPNKAVSVQNLARSKAIGDKSKSTQNLNKPRLSLVKSLGRSEPELVKNKINASKGVVKVTAKPLMEVKSKTAKSTITKPPVANNSVSKSKPEVAKKLVKKIEVKPTHNETTRIVKDKNLGVSTKKQVEIKRNIALRKPESLKDSKKVTVVEKKTEPTKKPVKLDLNRTKTFLDKVPPKDKFYLDSEDFIVKDNKPKNIASDKHLDYNSDDSGNISNEVDGDEAHSTASVRSRTSTESLPTVLDSTINDVEVPCEISVIVDEIPKKIFFRTGVVSQLESQRDERLSGVIVSFQSNCRGYLARKKLQQKKLQDLAVRCIQRNVRKFMVVRDWPWWRLLVRVTPLLNVHRTEEELRAKTEELEVLKLKLQKLETDRTSLKTDNDKLEAKLSEMTADLAEEHSTATLAAERLDAETSERLRLEKELSETKHKNKELQQASERLEMELLYAKSDLNGIAEEDEEGSEGDGVYKQRYERALKELEFTKRRLQQQHEDDLEQLVGLKKQLEKKLADAYEEVEEQRQVVGTWKRKVQKLTGEMNDLKLLLEEQSSRNNLLEKKQRKYDSEAAMLHDELKKEKQAKDRLSREREVYIAEKYSMDSSLADVRLELELKEEKLAALQREFDEITCGGKTEEEVTILRKQKIDCERRLQDQEEELDELAGQVQLLEQAKLRLEMSLESMRKEAKKEAQIREEEVEEARCNAQKKVKALEQQLENEHEERTTLLREKHELERRLQAAADAERQDRAGDEALLHRLKRDLKRTKVLLKDTQAQLERQKAETPGKNMIRQLRNQLEDLECARAIALKTKQSLEQELAEMQLLLDDAHKQKADAEDRANVMLREKTDLQTQVEENEEELAEVLKKYKAAVQQMSVDQMALQEQVCLVSELEVERNHLKEQLAELSTRLETAESMGGASSNLLYKRSELKVKELESKLELEQTTRSRMEVQITRLKETVDKLQNEITTSRVKEQQAQDQVRKIQRQLREVKEELNKSLAKESEVIIKKKELEKRCETLEAESATARADLRLALKRIDDLQSAIQGELEDGISNESDSEDDSYGSDESVNTFLANHKLGSPIKNDKSSIANDLRRLSSTSRSSTSSNLGKDSSYA
ncbi:unconventional myosin-XVIIIa isoform X5 [Euwallacea similis]|uniref:unconventional myosin-XVIIIa isoform X5 n=1 Tax=Euwallacea similis TaxID=1736056 RepID=UPI003450688F